MRAYIEALKVIEPRWKSVEKCWKKNPFAAKKSDENSNFPG